MYYAETVDARVGKTPPFYLKKIDRVHKTGYRYISKEEYKALHLNIVDELPVNDKKGWYCTFEKFEDADIADKALQLTSSGSEKPAYRLEFEISPISDHVKIPYGKGGIAKHLEPLCRDYPPRGGASQILIEKTKIKLKRKILIDK